MAFSQNIARLRDLLQNFDIGEVKLLKDMSAQLGKEAEEDAET